VTHPGDTVETFLEGVHVVAAALASPAVAEAWDRPSVLEGQRVSGLVGHLARGGVWVVADYLDAGAPEGPVDFTSASDYFATLMGAVSPDDHQANRERGATIAAVGRVELLRALDQHVDALGPRLRSLEMSHLLAVINGKVIRLDDYLATRIVEQVVHLDDLARSIDHDPWPMPPAAHDLTIAVGIDIARHQAGALPFIRALYRQGFAQQLLPVF